MLSELSCDQVSIETKRVTFGRFVGFDIILTMFKGTICYLLVCFITTFRGLGTIIGKSLHRW